MLALWKDKLYSNTYASTRHLKTLLGYVVWSSVVVVFVVMSHSRQA